MPPGMIYPPPPGPYPPFFGQPMPMPMPMMPPPGLFRPHKSFARIIFTTLASIIFGLSLTLNIYLLAYNSLGGGLSGGSGIIQSVVVPGDPKTKIALVPIAEPIWDPTAHKFDQTMTAIENDPTVKAVVLEINTPGGTVTASDEIYARIHRFKATMSEKGRSVPIVVSMGAIAASGGYYVACAGDYIFAERTTITGSIGVIFPMINVSELATKYGVKEISIAAPEHGMKNAGSSLAPLKDNERAYIQALANNFYGTFTTVVTDSRKTAPNPLKKPIQEIADGRVYTAKEAEQLGLIDKIGYPTEAYDKAASMAGVSSKHVVRYTPKPPTLFEMLSSQSQSGVSPAQSAAASQTQAPMGSVTINGVNVNFDVRALLDELGRPRPLYLWRGY
jgi:protease IV